MTSSLGESEHLSAISYKITLPLDRAGCVTLQVAFNQNDSGLGDIGSDSPRLPSQAPSDPALVCYDALPYVYMLFTLEN